jgi:hypothetical protein
VDAHEFAAVLLLCSANSAQGNALISVSLTIFRDKIVTNDERKKKWQKRKKKKKKRIF